MNSYRSAISLVHEKVDGEEVGKHPLISRMMKGIFNERPPRPKYDSVWKVETVLSWKYRFLVTTKFNYEDYSVVGFDSSM